MKIQTSCNSLKMVASLFLGLACALLIFVSPVKANALEISTQPDYSSLQVTLDQVEANNGYVINPIANQADVLNVYWTFTGLLNGTSVHDKIVYREYKSISFKNSYSQLSPVNIGVRATGKSGEYFSQVRATGIGSVETWRCRYSIR